MAEEKPTQEKPAQEKPTQDKQAKNKRPKINQMTLDELNKKLDEVKQKMGNLASRYALQLLKRKKELTGQ